MKICTKLSCHLSDGMKKILLVMKITTLILTISILQVSASSFAQKITLSKNNISLKQLFREIRKQTGFNVSYSDQEINDRKTLDVKFNDAPLKQVLDVSLEGKYVSFIIGNSNIIIKPLEQLATGKFYADVVVRIVDEFGKPLPGASIKIKNTTSTAITNEIGVVEFKAVPHNTTFIISYIGYKTIEIIVGEAKSFTIQMEPISSSLEQVMVTGYQTISKERATGSYDVIGEDVLKKKPVSNLSTALYGLIPGMQGKENEDESVNFLIRGTGSFYANSAPLVVVDGFPVADGTLNTINPNDVFSVTVLKDAAAASIWGAKSANGVIVITTKKGKEGKLSIEGNAFTRVSERIDLNQVLTQANSADHVRYEKLAWDNNWMNTPYAGSLNEIYSPLTLAQEYMWKRQQGTINQAQMNAGLDSLSKINNRGQIEDYLLRRGLLNQYNLSLSGATEKARHYASVLYEKNKSGFVKTGYDKATINYNNEYKPFSFLTFSFGTFLQYVKAENSGASIGEIEGVSPYETLLNPDGNYSVNLALNREQLANLPLSKFPYPDWNYNLLREVRGRKLTNETLNARIQTGINLKLLPGLSLDTRFQYERRKTEANSYYSDDTYLARSAVNSMTNYDQVNKVVKNNYLPKGGQLRSTTGDYDSFLLRSQVNFEKNFANNHTINAIAGFEMSRYTTTSKALPYVYGYYPDKLQSSVPEWGYGSSVNQLTNFLNYNVNIEGSGTVFNWERDKYVSFYGNIGYTYKGKYNLTTSIRSDASNYITDDPSLRWSPLWSVGAMWNVSEESFMQSASFIDRLSMRFTYGRNGNAEKSTSTKTLVYIGTAINPSTGTIGGGIASYGNPLLRWEKTTTTNIGLDFSFFKQALFGKIDLYRKMGSDITGLVVLPAATGVESQKFNNSKILNKGLELELGTNLNITKHISYSPILTYSYNYNRVIDLNYPNMNALSLLDGTFVQGRPIGALYSYTWLGMNNGVPYVEGVNKYPSDFNSTALYTQGLGLSFLNYEGTTIPPHTFGLTNNFSIHDFYVTALVVGKFGGVYRNPVFNYATIVGSAKTYVNNLVNEVFAGNPDIPGFSLPNNTQTYAWDRYAPYLNTLVENSSFVELKEISIGYNLPKNIITKAGLSNARLYVQGRNLGLLYRANKKNYHPEWLPGTNRPVNTYTIGASIQF